VQAAESDPKAPAAADPALQLVQDVTPAQPPPTQPPSPSVSGALPTVPSGLVGPSPLAPPQQGADQGGAAAAPREPIAPGASAVSGAEAQTRDTSDVGDLLSKSQSAPGVIVEHRNQIVTDPHVRGYHVGQLLTQFDEGFWFPARQDLDTIVSKIDSRAIRDVTVLKGPFSVRYGPGLAFLDVESLDTPRYKDGFEGHGITSLNYKTNEQQWHGIQRFWGGGADWGFRIGYDLNTGNNYETGADLRMPSSFNTQNFTFAIGLDLSPDSHIEFKGLRLDQHDVLFPGEVFNINQLITDGYGLRYILENQEYFDRFEVTAWYNYTRFNGDDFNPAQRAFIPVLNGVSVNGSTPLILNAFTDGDVTSEGLRQFITWGKAKCPQLTLGMDVHYLSNQLNEFDQTSFPNTGTASATTNAGIPRSHSLDPGVFADGVWPVGKSLVFKGGTRFDTVWTNIEHTPPVSSDFALSQGLGNDTFDRQFSLWSAYLSSEYKYNKYWTGTLSFGTAERPPTLTELYANGPFQALLQNGLDSVIGNPNLQPERSYQFDVGLQLQAERLRAGINGFYSWINNYITFENEGFFTANGGNTPFTKFKFVNTELATLAGGEAYTEIDVTEWLTPFGTIMYVEGRDHTRDNRGAFFIPFGAVPGAAEEPLPGIPPLEARVGFRVHEARKAPRWAVELAARIVNRQERFAESLLEQYTGGFTVFDLAGYWQVNKNFLLTAGVENIGDRNYREHLDLRDLNGGGTGVFQPGTNIYFGAQLSY
jgi:outer membrane receptor protein involved in Fe transport